MVSPLGCPSHEGAKVGVAALPNCKVKLAELFLGDDPASLQVIKGGNFKTNPWGKVFA